jgi:hypothetical protein
MPTAGAADATIRVTAATSSGRFFSINSSARTAKTLNFSDHSTGKAPGVTRSPVPIEHGLKRAN